MTTMTDMKKIYTTILLLTTILYSVFGQTNVSGGIYTNTTWTLANSPYIVIDTVVVFPGVTLTIQPGVEVRFDNNIRLEIRQASIIAQGTTIDSIFFTSNASSPTMGIWDAIFLNGGNLISKFNFCHFKYAKSGINSTIIDTLNIANSIFDYNNIGLNAANGYISIDSCNFINNTTGLSINPIAGTLNNCNISYNQLGAWNINHSNLNNNIICYNKNGIKLIENSQITSTSFSNNQVTGVQASCLNDFYNCFFEFNQFAIGNLDSAYIWSTGGGLFKSISDKLDNCYIRFNQGSGLICQRDTIENCMIDSNGFKGIVMVESMLTNSSIRYNDIGVHISDSLNGVWGGWADPSSISNNNIEYNGIGIQTNSLAGDSGVIVGNTIQFCGIGIENSINPYIITKNIINDGSIGIKLKTSNSQVFCNEICNNTMYGLYYQVAFGSNFDASNNYWCTPDSSSTTAVIYDGYDNINYGLVDFMPIDTLQCYLITGLSINIIPYSQFSIFPNPVSNYLTIALPTNVSVTEIKIFNLLGELEYSSTTTRQKTGIDVSTLTNGMYVIQIASSDKISRQKFIKE